MNNSNKVFGEPIQILQLNPKRQYELVNAKLEKIFLHKHLENVNLSVVSIAGAFRKGKSFLLGFLLRYLNSYYDDSTNQHADWLSDESSRLAGFAWRGGSERHTTGIWMWSKVFTKTMPDGQQIGIVLMDTQGTFDNQSSMHNNVTIFALSTMLSSIQIYNLFNNVQDDDLQHLQLFTEYGRIAMKDSENDSKPFQQIMFLVRDWNFPYEHDYGIMGGAALLDRILEIKPGQSPENQSVRKHLRSCFDEITCFLMPPPGEQTRINANFDGKLSDLTPEFIQNLKILVPYLLKPMNVARTGLKKIHGMPITPYSFYNLIQQYWKAFKSGVMPEAKNILTATTESVCLTAKHEAVQFYYRMITVYAESDDVDLPQLINIHKNLSNEAMKIYIGKAIIGDKAIRNHYQQELTNYLQENLIYYAGYNQSRKTKSLEETVQKMSQEIKELRNRDYSNDLVLALQMQLEMYQLENKQLQAEQLKRMEKEIIDGVGINREQAVVPKQEKWCKLM